MKSPAGQAAAVDADVRPSGFPKGQTAFKPLPVRRKQRKARPIRFLPGLLLSGGIGLLGAYYAVSWIRRENSPFPRIEWLPFLPPVKSTAKPPEKSQISSVAPNPNAAAEN